MIPRIIESFCGKRIELKYILDFFTFMNNYKYIK